MPDPVIFDARRTLNFYQPQIEKVRIMEARNPARRVDHKRDQHYPGRLEHEKQLGAQNGVADRERIGHAAEHLGPRQRHEQQVAIKLRQPNN